MNAKSLNAFAQRSGITLQLNGLNQKNQHCPLYSVSRVHSEAPPFTPFIGAAPGDNFWLQSNWKTDEGMLAFTWQTSTITILLTNTVTRSLAAGAGWRPTDRALCQARFLELGCEGGGRVQNSHSANSCLGFCIRVFVSNSGFLFLTAGFFKQAPTKTCTKPSYPRKGLYGCNWAMIQHKTHSLDRIRSIDWSPLLALGISLPADSNPLQGRIAGVK